MFYVLKPFVASAFATGSLFVAFLCEAGPAFSREPSVPGRSSDWLVLPDEEMDASSLSAAAGGGSSGHFLPPYERTGGGGRSFSFGPNGVRSMMLYLEITFALKEGTSPGLTYAISRTKKEGRRFAYLCIVHHQYTGEESDEFTYDIGVRDNTGEIEQLLKIGESSFMIKYTIVVDRDQREESEESLNICETPVDNENGRVFIVDMLSEPPVVRQVDYPLPTAMSSRDYGKKAREVLDHLSKSGISDDIKSRQLMLRASPAAN